MLLLGEMHQLLVVQVMLTVVVWVQRLADAVVVSMSVVTLAGQWVVGLVTAFWGLYQNQVVVVVLVRSFSYPNWLHLPKRVVLLLLLQKWLDLVPMLNFPRCFYLQF